MTLTSKQVKDLNKMNEAARRVGLGDMLFSPLPTVEFTSSASVAANVAEGVKTALGIETIPIGRTLAVFLLGDNDQLAKLNISGSVAEYDTTVKFSASAPETIRILSTSVS